MGGNVFKNENGKSLTSRINKHDVVPTVSWLEKILGIELKSHLLGTTGKAATSGDIDIAVDEQEVTKEELIQKLVVWVKETGSIPKDWIKKSGAGVHFKTPIAGKETNGFVQTDFMFGDPKWLKWSLRAGEAGSQFKGVHRHILLASIAKAQNLKWSFKFGLINRETNQPITTDPNEIAKKLLGDDAIDDDLNTVETIIRKIKTRSDYEELIVDFREYLSKDPSNPTLESFGMEIGSSEWFRFLMNKFT